MNNMQRIRFFSIGLMLIIGLTWLFFIGIDSFSILFITSATSAYFIFFGINIFKNNILILKSAS